MNVIVFVSTGRCGTQFLTRYLAAAAGDRAVVTHEPIGAKYAPKQTLRVASLEELLLQSLFQRLESVRQYP